MLLLCTKNELGLTHCLAHVQKPVKIQTTWQFLSMSVQICSKHSSVNTTEGDQFTPTYFTLLIIYLFEHFAVLRSA